MDDELEELRAIERPDDHEQVDAYLAAVEQTLASARALGAAASKGNEGLARTRGIDTQRHTREALGLASRLGAETCASQ